MFRILLFLFLTLPLIEIYLLIRIGAMVGAGWTVFLCIFTAVAGAMLLRQQGFSTVRKVQAAMARGEVPALEMLEGAILLICGVFLLTPGFFTDILGFLGLIPPFRQALVLRAIKQAMWQGKYEVKMYRPEAHGSNHRHSTHRIINGESKREDD
jgi:UPF0716 protein FxsA